MAYVSAAMLVEELREFTVDRWIGEPPDVAALRRFTLPPMGNLPCVLYCNFDLFWAGEQLQVVRQAALDGDLRLPELCSVTAMLLERTAARTAKWEMPETVQLLRRAASILAEWRPDTSREYRGRDRAPADGAEPDTGGGGRDHSLERPRRRRATAAAKLGGRDAATAMSREARWRRRRRPG